MWLDAAQQETTDLDRRLLRFTRWLIGAIAWALASAVLVLAAAGVTPRLLAVAAHQRRAPLGPRIMAAKAMREVMREQRD